MTPAQAKKEQERLGKAFGFDVGEIRKRGPQIVERQRLRGLAGQISPEMQRLLIPKEKKTPAGKKLSDDIKFIRELNQTILFGDVGPR